MAIQLRERPGAAKAHGGEIAFPPLARIALAGFAALVLVGGAVKYGVAQSSRKPVATASSLTTSGGKLRPRSETRSILGDAGPQARSVRSIPMDRSTVATIPLAGEREPEPPTFGFAGLQRAQDGAYQGFREVTRPANWR
ncbi:MAG: hypothetical protein JWN93_957 [Hyphomicrobiales bacterium]|nr:hypothetical protein [Hyphomicrobiales bacterium]